MSRFPDQTLLQLHNHALGKNIGWTSFVPQLAQAGYRTLLQIHDFAEDFRPGNYQALLSGLASDQPLSYLASGNTESGCCASRCFPQRRPGSH